MRLTASRCSALHYSAQLMPPHLLKLQPSTRYTLSQRCIHRPKIQVSRAISQTTSQSFGSCKPCASLLHVVEASLSGGPRAYRSAVMVRDSKLEIDPQSANTSIEATVVMIYDRCEKIWVTLPAPSKSYSRTTVPSSMSTWCILQ